VERFAIASVIETPVSIVATLAERSFEVRIFKGGARMTITHDRRGALLAWECSLPSEVSAISPFADKLMLLLRNCGSVEGVSDVEIALREALANAIVHGNHEDRRKHVHVTCRCESDEVSIAVRDEGNGFDINSVPDPTAPENITLVHGRGIHVMRALIDEVRCEEGGVVVHMRKSTGEASKLLAKGRQANETN
jgi:serine/threonine-protein kinase RsbW